MARRIAPGDDRVLGLEHDAPGVVGQHRPERMIAVLARALGERDGGAQMGEIGGVHGLFESLINAQEDSISHLNRGMRIMTRCGSRQCSEFAAEPGATFRCTLMGEVTVDMEDSMKPIDSRAS